MRGDGDFLSKYIRNFTLVYSKDFDGYDRIEKEISKCDCLLAIVDEYWTSSTWKASEVTYANGDGGSGLTENPSIMPIPVFVLPVHEKVDLAFLKGYPGPMILPGDVDKAVEIIAESLM